MSPSRTTKAQLEEENARLRARIVEAEDRVATEEARRMAAEDLVATRDEELEGAREEAAAAAQQATAAIQAVANQAPGVPHPPGNNEVIPKPQGSGGSTYNIRRAMHLGPDKEKYNRLMHIVHFCTNKANVDWSKDYSHQDPRMLGHLFHSIQEKEPYFARFEASWAAADMVKQYMRNRRKYEVRRGYAPGPLLRAAARRPQVPRAATIPGARLLTAAGNASGSGASGLPAQEAGAGSGTD